MSDEIPQVTTEAKIKLLEDWIALIESDLATMQKERDAEFGLYQKQKALYDGWLAKRYRRVTKIEKEMAGRRKEIDRIRGEIGAILGRPPPGVLPELPTDRSKRKYVRKSATPSTPTEASASVAIPPEPLPELSGPLVFTEEERRAMNEEAQKS